MVDKYSGLSPYNYTLDNPMKFIDPTGNEVKVYTENHSFCHAWISVGEGNKMIVYTYGRYDGTYPEWQGLFMLFGIAGAKNQPAQIPGEWVLNEINLVIKAEEKRAVLKQLSAIGINSSTLFPEIEYQGKHLISMYGKV